MNQLCQQYMEIISGYLSKLYRAARDFPFRAINSLLNKDVIDTVC